MGIKWIWALSFLFVALNAVFLYFEVYWVSLVPVALTLLLASLVSVEKIF